jgi:hypothetical protein
MSRAGAGPNNQRGGAIRTSSRALVAAASDKACRIFYVLSAQLMFTMGVMKLRRQTEVLSAVPGVTMRAQIVRVHRQVYW